MKLDDFNVATYASIMLGCGDITWLVRDITHNGVDLLYITIMVIFTIGNFGLAWGLHKHHKRLNKHSKNIKLILPVKRKE